MSQPAIYLLLFLALVLPVPGAIAVRLLGRRLGGRALAVGAALIFLVAMASALLLASANISVLRVGDLSLLLPAARRSDELVLLPEPVAEGQPPPDAGPPAIPTLTPRPSATARPAATPSATATVAAATATPEPTAAPTAEPTAEPTAAPAASEPRRYTVQAGDSLRAIAERFGVTVAAIIEANDLTPAQADSLRVGQELVIP